MCARDPRLRRPDRPRGRRRRRRGPGARRATPDRAPHRVLGRHRLRRRAQRPLHGRRRGPRPRRRLPLDGRPLTRRPSTATSTTSCCSAPASTSRPTRSARGSAAPTCSGMAPTYVIPMYFDLDGLDCLDFPLEQWPPALRAGVRADPGVPDQLRLPRGLPDVLVRRRRRDTHYAPVICSVPVASPSPGMALIYGQTPPKDEIIGSALFGPIPRMWSPPIGIANEDELDPALAPNPDAGDPRRRRHGRAGRHPAVPAGRHGARPARLPVRLLQRRPRGLLEPVPQPGQHLRVAARRRPAAARGRPPRPPRAAPRRGTSTPSSSSSCASRSRASSSWPSCSASTTTTPRRRPTRAAASTPTCCTTRSSTGSRRRT